MLEVSLNGSKALIGGMTKYFRIRQGDEVLASYDSMCEQFHEGRFAVLVASIGVALCMCVPAFQLTFGRLSARRSKASTRTPARLDSATSDTSFSGQAGACPCCDAELSEGAVLCISCGYHLQKGTRLETRAKLAKSQKRGNVLGILNSGNAIAIFTATGLALGVTTALVGGALYGTGQLFEIGIYTFVGLVLGTVIGGGVGYALTPILPEASHEVASEQLVGGLISIVGGFMAIGIAILAGKWLTAIIVSGVGLVMITGGVKVLLPSKAK